MKKNNFEFNVLVKDKPIFEYSHENNIFVEGRKKSSFELQFVNHTYNRVLVIPSVDGINTLEGTSATHTSKGYLVASKQTLRIPGWTVDANNVAKFVFQGKDKGYAQHATLGGEVNSGVLGLLIFAEKQNFYGSLNINTGYRHSTYPETCSRGLSTSIPQCYTMNNSSVGSNNIANNLVSDQPFALGTGFGKQAYFATRDVHFERGAQLEEMIVYYDDKQGLIGRGVEILKRRERSALPRAFVTSGCTPPPSWKG